MSNVYNQVSGNKTRSFIVFAFFIIFIFLIAYLFTYLFELGPEFLFFALIFSLLSSFASYFYGDKIVLSLNHAKPASRKEFFNFYTVTENLSLANQTPMPKIYVIEDPSPNAFATGRDPNHAVVCATTGLLQKLNRSQLEAVVAHELSHIKNYDIRLMMIVSVLIGSLTILTNTLRFRSSSDRDNRSSSVLMVIGLILIIFSPIIAKLIQLAISRSREYLADASAVKLTRFPQGLIEALTIISSDSTPSKTASSATASLYISNPFKDGLSTLFSTHPPIKDRINALQKMM
jgi:heat shock protein HtpX